MTTVIITGWNEGFQKIRFTHLLQRELGYSLRQAKYRTDAVTDDVEVALKIPGDPQGVVDAMRELGAKVEVLVLAGA